MAQSDNLILDLQGVAKRYGKVQVLEPLNLGVRDGEFLTILGPSGSGKTTVIRMIGGFTDVSEGRIVLDGADIASTPTHLRPFHTVFQDYALFPHMTVTANVGYALSVRRKPKAEIDTRVAEVLDTVELGHLAGRYPSELSGGQQQRIALARAIVGHPRVVLLDEPLSALDAELRRSMQVFLKELQQRIETTFVFITHDQEEAISMSDRIVVMDKGRLAQVGTPTELYQRPQSLFVARFFGENNILPATPRGSGSFDCALGTIDRSAPTGLPRFHVSIRPEDLHLGAARAAPRTTLQAFDATIRRAIFLGPTWEIEFAPDAAPEQPIKARVSSAEVHSGLDAGARVIVNFDPARIGIIAEA